MADSTEKIIGTTYDIQEKWLTEVAPKYFDTTNLNMIKVGMLGYTTEIMSSALKDSINHRLALYPEAFKNTASMPRSIYNFAKTQNMSPANAKPAKMPVIFAIRIDDIMAYGARTRQTYEFTISNTNKFLAGDYTFMLQYPVRIIVKENDTGGLAVTASYKIDVESEIETIQSPYLKTWVEKSNGYRTLFIMMDIFEMDLIEKTFNVYSDNIIDNIFYDMTYTEQLAYFKVLYTVNNTQIILPKYFNDAYTPTDVSQWCYYTFPDDATLQIFFSTLGNSFRPAYNSDITIQAYVTHGSEGNFEYTGTIYFKFKEDALKAIPVQVAVATGYTAGGTDRPTLMQFKEEVIEDSLLRKCIVTESDLNIFFNQVVKDTVSNGSKIKFIKKRDDVIKRSWSCFLLLRDTDKHPIPTNTADINTTLDEIQTRFGYRIKAGTSVLGEFFDNYAKETFRFIKETEDPTTITGNSEDKVVYTLPYTVDIRLAPVTNVTYFRTDIDTSETTSFSYINDKVVDEFIVNNITCFRDPFTMNKYKISCKLATSIRKDDVPLYVKLRCIANDGTSDIGYLDLELEDVSTMVFSGYIETDDYFDVESRMKVIRSFKDMLTGQVIEESLMTEIMGFRLGLLYKTQDDTSRIEQFGLMTDINDYCLTNIYDVDNVIALFRGMDSITQPEMYINTDNWETVLKNVPLVRYSYMYSSLATRRALFNMLNAYETSLIDNFDNLEENVPLDLKFYNTYGRTRYMTSNRIDIKLSMLIKLGGIPTQDDIDEIRKFIIDFVDACNDNDMGDLFAYSNLITALETSFDNIVYSKYVSLEDSTTMQTIINKYPEYKGMTKDQIINFVPEHLTLNQANLTVNFI